MTLSSPTPLSSSPMTQPPQHDPPGSIWSYPALGAMQETWRPGPAPAAPSPPEPEGTPPRGERHWLWLGALLAVVALVGGVVWWGARSPDSTDAGPTSTRYTPPPPLPRPSSACAPLSPAPDTPAGWHQVDSRLGVGYDVPADWTVESCGTIVGWEAPCPTGPFGFCPVQLLSAGARLETAQCPDSVRAQTGLDASPATPDLRRVARDTAALARKIYTSTNGRAPTVALDPPQELTLAGMPAVKVVAHVTDIESDACTGPSATHVVVAITAPGRAMALVFVASIQRGYPGAPDEALADDVVGTLRPY